MKYILVVIFIVISILNIYSQKVSSKSDSVIKYWIREITKPLIMPLLTLIYISFAKVIQPLLILAFIFGWLGDNALMLHIKKYKKALLSSTDVDDTLPMVLGMLFFACGHISYIILFLQDVKLASISVLDISVYGIYIVFALIMFRYLTSHGLLKAGNNISDKLRLVMKIGVVIYMIALTLMSYTSFLRYINIKSSLTLIGYIGTILFVSSDTTLSIKMLGQNDKMSERYIMASYIVAQTFIMMSYL